MIISYCANVTYFCYNLILIFIKENKFLFTLGFYFKKTCGCFLKIVSGLSFLRLKRHKTLYLF